jgi:cytochrome c-type biogenesis protein CcmH
VSRAAALLLAVALALPAGGAFAAEPRTTLSDVEDEVMCPVCGTPLSLAENAPQAVRQRAFIQRLIDQGKSKQQIKDALVAEYGPAVLATPEDEGFDLAAYIVPALAILIAAAAISAAALRWRRARATAAAGDAPQPLPAADAARLEADLERYEL